MVTQKFVADTVCTFAHLMYTGNSYILSSTNFYLFNILYFVRPSCQKKGKILDVITAKKA
jgi:hypothetical protein